MATQALDDHFLGASEPVHPESDPLLGHAQHNHQYPLVGDQGRIGRAQFQHLGQGDQRHRPPVGADGQFALDAAHTVRLHPQDALHVPGGHSHHLAVHLHQEHVAGGQGEGQGQGEGGAPAGNRVHFDQAMQPLQVLPHHVQPHPPAGEACGLRQGGEAGAEDELHRLLVAQAGHLLHRQQPSFHGRPPHGFQVNPRPVIGHPQDDGVALLSGPQVDRASTGLARRLPTVGRLDAVIHRIAQEMGEGILRGLQHLAVHLGLGPFNLQCDLLALLPGQVAHHAGEEVEEGGDGQHPHPAHPLLQIIGEQGQVAVVAGEAADQAVHLDVEGFEVLLVAGQEVQQRSDILSSVVSSSTARLSPRAEPQAEGSLKSLLRIYLSKLGHHVVEGAFLPLQAVVVGAHLPPTLLPASQLLLKGSQLGQALLGAHAGHQELAHAIQQGVQLGRGHTDGLLGHPWSIVQGLS